MSGTATAPDWAIDKVEADGQLYSFKQARTYFYDGLTKPAKADRDSKLATMFRTLGDVVHLVQDMAQPQHTRNDGHFTGSLYEKYVDGANPKLTGGTIPVIQMARDFLTNNC